MPVACNVGVNTVVALARDIWSVLNALPCPNDTDACRQRSWDGPNVTCDVKAIWDGASSKMDKATLLASKAPHSSDWLYALPITACSLRLSDEAIRVTVGLCLGLNICEPHPCPCGAPCGAAEAAATRKRAKFAEIIQSHIFVPIAIETLGPINMDGQRFLDSLDERLSSVSSDPRETTFLYQRLSVLIQIFNPVAFRGTLLPETVTEG